MAGKLTGAAVEYATEVLKRTIDHLRSMDVHHFKGELLDPASKAPLWSIEVTFERQQKKRDE